jgi:hypothetical protein
MLFKEPYMSTSWVLIREVAGELQAEILRGLLEANEIPVLLSQEGIGRVYGLSVSTLGRVEILVPSEFVEAAKSIMADYESGKLEDLEMDENP